ncbi:hypothetical protein L9F63_022654, partial [Diploptera punctata]
TGAQISLVKETSLKRNVIKDNLLNNCENHTVVNCHIVDKLPRDLDIILGQDWLMEQVSDASGRYSSEFFYGNDFWLGSYEECKLLRHFKLPPFPVQFHVTRLQISLAKNLTPSPKLLVYLHAKNMLGMCRRSSSFSYYFATSSRQVKDSYLQFYSQTSKRQFLRVRPVPGPYNVLLDVKLQILGGVLVVIIVLIAAGTCYEMLQSSGEENNANTDTQKTSTTPGLVSRLLLCFSAIRNGRKILNCSTPEESLTSVHGLRFFSLTWVILVHTYLQLFAIGQNKTLRTLTERNFMFQTVSNATFSVDTFFFISGLLVTFLYLRSVKKQPEEAKTCNMMQSTTKFFTLIFYRFIRLTPAYLFVLGLVEVSMRYLHNRSVFEPKFIDHINCDNYWWRNALYLNSLFPKKEMCMLWSWYMANDTQFYVIGILLLLISVKYFRAVVGMWGLFLVSTWCTTGYISYRFKYLARIQEPFAQFDALYDKPWTRLGPYLIGMATGWLLHRTKCKIEMPLLSILGWSLSLLCLFSLVYGLQHVQLGIVGSALYVSLGHTAWGMSLAWIVVACCTGYGGVVNSLLSYRVLFPLSRLTYCAYLVHPLVMVLAGFSIDGPIHLHNLMIFIVFLGNTVAAFTLSFLISLAFEAPIVNLLKIIMKNRERLLQSNALVS